MTKILIVEDETIIAKDIQNTLAALNYNVCGTAISGEKAIKLAGYSARPGDQVGLDGKQPRQCPVFPEPGVRCPR